MKRVLSIDIVRGIVMIIMALDHTRDLMHVNSITQQPTDLLTTNPALFFTRWITHLCAPTFVFLSGTSAYISFKTKKNIEETRRFLLTRGLWLIIIEFTLVNFGLWFDIHFNLFFFEVIATIGLGFIILSLFLKASVKTIAIVGLAIIFLHNLVPLAPSSDASLFERIIIALFSPGAFPLGGGKLFVMGYPPIPWLGIMLIGFATGKLFELPAARRKSIFLKIGLAATALFIILRAMNVYGDPVPFTTQKNALYSFLSFINVTKYPPSLLFCLVTLGIMFIILSMMDGRKSKLTEIAAVYGKVPLFYFIVHFYILHPVMFLVVFLQGYQSADLLFGFNLGRPKGVSGVNLWCIYFIWIGLVIMLYPLCKWYGKYKENHKEKKWLRYL